MKKAKILIVEDEAIIAMELESQLGGLGYEVTSVVNTGEKAIAKTEADKPDLILMDIRIQGDKDGIETAEVIRNKFGIPIVFSTAYLDQERIERAKITMPFGYVLKPIQERDLKVTLEMALYVAKVDKERRIAEDEILLTLNATTDGIWKWEFETNELYFSDKYYTMLGYSPGAFPANFENWVDLIHPEDRDRSLSIANEYLKTKPDNYENEFRLRMADGGYKWIKAKAQIVERDSAGNAIRMIGNHADVTKRKKAEESLIESESLFRKIAENYPNSYLSIIEKDFTVAFTAGQEFKKQNLNPEEFIGLSLETVFGDKSDIVREHYKKTFEGEERIFELFINNQNQLYHTVPLKSDDGQIHRILSVVENVTERTQTINKLRSSEAQKQAILDGISSNIAFVNENLEIIWANKTAANSVSKELEDMIGFKCHEFWADPNKPCENCPTVKAFQTKQPEKTIMHTPDGGVWEEGGEPVFDKNGKLTGVVEIAKDITKQFQTEKALKENEKKYRTLFENSPYGVFLVDNNAKYIEVNDAACEMTGYSKEELLCLSIPEVSSADEEIRQQDIKPFLDIQNTGKGEGIIHFRHKEGHIFKARLRGVKIDNQTTMGICEKLTD